MTPVISARAWTVVLLCFLTLLFIGSPLQAQFCMEDDPPLIYGPFDCAAEPGHPRAFYPSTFNWRGQGHLMFSDGNHLSLRTIVDPQDPT